VGGIPFLRSLFARRALNGVASSARWMTAFWGIVFGIPSSTAPHSSNFTPRQNKRKIKTIALVVQKTLYEFSRIAFEDLVPKSPKVL